MMSDVTLAVSGLPIYQVADMRVRYPELIGKSLLRNATLSVPLADRLDLFIRQFRRVVLDAEFWPPAAPPHHSVVGVRCGRAGVQMCGIHTGADVTVMADFGSFRDRPDIQLMTQPVSPVMRIPVVRNLTVSVTVYPTRPHPARPEFRTDDRAVLVDLGPEARLNRTPGNPLVFQLDSARTASLVDAVRSSRRRFESWLKGITRQCPLTSGTGEGWSRIVLTWLHRYDLHGINIVYRVLGP
jgi:hypothetical protein